MKRLTYYIKRLLGLAWVVRRCGFPYKSGYATYLPHKRMVLDTGLTKEHAQLLCDELNGLGAKQ